MEGLDAPMATESGARLGPTPAVSVPIEPTPLGYRVTKRLVDLTAASLGLLVVSPILLAATIAILVESGGPVLFHQQRLGLGGRQFTVVKFRTMWAAADEGAHRQHSRDLIRGERRSPGGEVTWTPIVADPRVTRLGAFLRRSHIDELPQLLNVLRGEMSLVGPRPPIPYEVEVYQPWHLRRLSVIPGLTGLWQVTAWGRASFDEGVALDLEYIRRRSLGLDLSIIGRTLWQIATGRQF